jgi:hypothetical protein
MKCDVDEKKIPVRRVIIVIVIWRPLTHHMNIIQTISLQNLALKKKKRNWSWKIIEFHQKISSEYEAKAKSRFTTLHRSFNLAWISPSSAYNVYGDYEIFVQIFHVFPMTSHIFLLSCILILNSKWFQNGNEFLFLFLFLREKLMLTHSHKLLSKTKTRSY